MFSKALTFSGRATRAEFWWFFLLEVIVCSLLLAMDLWIILSTVIATGASLETLLRSPFEFMLPHYTLLTILPRFALSARRLHDTGRSGLWLFLHCIPVVGIVVLTILFCQPSTRKETHYGDPWMPDALAALKNTSIIGKDHPMQGYIRLDEVRQARTPEMQARRKLQIRALYEQRVLGQPQVQRADGRGVPA